jgi:hypothetical protein
MTYIYRILKVDEARPETRREEVMRLGIKEQSELAALEAYIMSRYGTTMADMVSTIGEDGIILCTCIWAEEIHPGPYVTFQIERPCILHLTDYIVLPDPPFTLDELYLRFNVEKEAGTYPADRYEAEEVKGASTATG